MVELTGLFIYPIKSLRGIAIPEALATPQGLALDIGTHRVFDRQWMVVKPNGSFLTQRQVPAMALIHTELGKNGVILSKARMPNCTVPYVATGEPAQAPETTQAKIWADTCAVQETPLSIGQWLTQALQYPEPLRLVKLATGTQRVQSKPDLLGNNTHTHFADAAPYLVTNTASLKKLNSELREIGENPVSMEHFRPNIVVQGLPAFAEHELETITLINQGVSAPTLRLCYPCQRCVMITIDPATAEKNSKQQPYRLLAAINPMPDSPKAPAFGINATLLSNLATIKLTH